MNQRLAFIVFIFSFFVVIYVGLIRKDKEDIDSKTMLPFQIKPMTLDRFRGTKPDSKKLPSVDEQNPGAPPVTTLEQFKKENPQYKVEQAKDGRVISLVLNGSEGFKSHRPVASFHPNHRDQVLAQAEAILNELSGVLGIQSQMTLGLPQVSSTDLSAQLVYQQTLENVPLVPAGPVSLVLGSDGSLKRLDSTYQPKVVVVNQRKLAGPGRPIMWIEAYEPVAQVRHANESREKGIQTILDAEDGRVILTRDKKIQ
jgi:hypothetical protein